MYQLSCPGKIFLAGEYSAIQGGLCFILNIDKRFELNVKSGTGNCSGIPQGSPADLYISKNKSFFDQFDLTFIDPYQGRGGFGASSAQFLLSYYLHAKFESVKNNKIVPLDFFELLSVYHNNSWNGVGVKPSGADLIAQFSGGIASWNKNENKCEIFSWPFQDLEFLAFPTGQKIATHEHLQTLKEISIESLQAPLKKIEKSFMTQDRFLFVEAMIEWQKALEKNNWVHESTLKRLAELKSDSRVLTAKGCGALGVDVILVIVETKNKVQFEKEWSQKLGVSFVSQKQISKGLLSTTQ